MASVGTDTLELGARLCQARGPGAETLPSFRLRAKDKAASLNPADLWFCSMAAGTEV